jgi:hypothetical protein
MNKFNFRDVVESPIGIGVVLTVITVAPPKWDENGKERYQYDIVHHGTNQVLVFEESEIKSAPHALPSVLEKFDRKSNK